MSQVQQAEVNRSGAAGSASSEPVYRIRNLAVAFAKQSGVLRKHKALIRAVDDLSLEIYEQEILSIVGESGSGKTTVARCLMGLNRATSGSIQFRGGVDVTKLQGPRLLDYWRQVQMIFQDPFESMYPRFDVFTIVSTPMVRLLREYRRPVIVENVSRLLSEVGLDPGETMHKLPHQLSGGERQRVSIARALAPNPEILIADEPITMLDASLRLNILSLLSEIKERRALTIVMITHDLASAKLMSDRTAVMYLGKLVELGPTERLLSRPHHPYTELILKSTPRLLANGEATREREGELRVPPKTLEDAQLADRGCVFRSRCAYATAVCAEVEPPLVEKAPAHAAACHNALNTN